MVTLYEKQGDGAWAKNDSQLIHSDWIPEGASVWQWFWPNGDPFNSGFQTARLTGTGLIYAVYQYCWWDPYKGWYHQQDLVGPIQC
jgi:hypothetical protein